MGCRIRSGEWAPSAVIDLDLYSHWVVSFNRCIRSYSNVHIQLAAKVLSQRGTTAAASAAGGVAQATDVSNLPVLITIKPCQSLTISTIITNHGPYDGDEVAQLYLSIDASSASVPVAIRQLVNFHRASVETGSQEKVSFVLSPEDNAVMRDPDFKLVVEPGRRTVWIGGSSLKAATPGGVEVVFEVVGETTLLSHCE
jgi:hypothetical protein